MDKEVYKILAETEENHWWFVARRKIIKEKIKGLKLPENAKIIEAGCGTGGNLQMLSKFGEVTGLEMDETARKFSQEQNIAQIKYAKMPNDIPVQDEEFDLIGLFDVLEHIEEDEETLKALYKKLKPNGKIILTVPAFPFLWSSHDTYHHHKKRYLIKELNNIVENSGFKIEYSSYYNFWLFPVIALVRLLSKYQKEPSKYHLYPPNRFFNYLLTKLFASESFLLKKIKLPFGSSIILTATKK